MTGPLDDPTQWSFELVPGNEVVQRLVTPLLDRGVEIIRLQVGGGTIDVGISAATEDEMSDIEEASKQVEESLGILATPSAEEVAVTMTEEPPVSEGELPASAEASPASSEDQPAESSGETPKPVILPSAESPPTPPAANQAPSESN